MSALTETPQIPIDEGAYVVQRADANPTIDMLPTHESSTYTLSRIARNKMLPVLFGLASFAAPTPSVGRVFSTAAISRSPVAGDRWLVTIDPFYFTEEPADPEEVTNLNALLHLPVTTGLELELRDD